MCAYQHNTLGMHTSILTYAYTYVSQRWTKEVKSPPGRFQGPYCGGWGSRCIKKLNRPAVGNIGDDAGLGLALKEEEVREPPACQTSQANGLLPWRPRQHHMHGGCHAGIALLLIHSKALMSAARAVIAV